MNYDDIIYLLLLSLTIILGYFLRNLKYDKEIFGSSFGVVIIVLVSGWHAIHPLLATLFTILLVKFSPKSYIHITSFIGLFSYLLFFRLCHLISIPMPPAHTNAILMILTLKLVGVCFEVHDTWKKKQKLNTLKVEEEKNQLLLELKYEEVNPSALDIFYYSFFYIGVLTGPYYKFRTYSDMIQSSPEHGGPDYLKATLFRLRHVPLYGILFLLSSYFFPLSFAEKEEIFRDYSFLFRVVYMTPVFFTFRMRIYSGFVLSECACMMAGLGAYPAVAENRPGKGPSNFKALEARSTKTSASKLEDYDFETIHNIDEWGADFTPTVRAGMRCWNMTVQFWLASHVYKRLKLAKPLKEALTMLTSAFWHGVHSGYYLSMLTVPFILAVEDFYDRIVRKKLSPTGQRVYDFVAWIIKMQNFAYMGMAFLLLRIDTTVHYWRSIGFIYHGLILFLHAIAQYVNLITSKVDKKLEKSRITSLKGECRVKYMRHGTKEKEGVVKGIIDTGDVIDISDVLGNAEVSTEKKTKK